MSRKITLLLITSLLLSACTERSEDHFFRDLAHIQADTLRIVITPGKLGMDKQRTYIRGLEHAILSSFAEGTGITYSFIQAISIDSSFAMVKNGQADIAAGLFSFESIQDPELVASTAYNSNSIAMVTQRPDPWYGPYWGHRGYPASIEQDYSHIDTIWQSAYQTMAIQLDSTRGKLTTSPLNPEALIEQVAMGKYRSAVVNEIVARAYARDFPNLDMHNTLDQGVDLVFAMRSNSLQLKGSLDTWLTNNENLAQVNALTEAYADSETRRSKKAFSHPHHQGSTFISNFDADFKAVGDTTGWDWRFLAALAFKESRFDTAALSNKGALGLMQLVPKTAIEMEIDSTMGERGAILAAANYLSFLNQLFRRSVPDKEERLGFILASYNAGPSHILDAQRLAKELELDHTVWKGNVERALLLLTNAKYHQRPFIKSGYCKGHSVFLFVREVLHYWEHYKRL